SQADCTVAAIPVKREEARAFGVIEVVDGGRILAFHEKVDQPPAMPGNAEMALASMGNYMFKTSALIEALERDAIDESSAHDFGRNVIPTMVGEKKDVFVYDFQKNRVPGEDEGHVYWRDIGTIDAYWAAQMDLVAIQPAFNLYNVRWPI